MVRYFTKPYTWNGGFYELALEFAARSDDRLLEALRAVWSLPDLDGCYLDPSREPGEQSRLHVERSLLEVGHLHGLASLPSGGRAACGTCLVREDAGSDWLVLYLPMGALGQALPVGAFPFDDADHDVWRVPLDEWLSRLGGAIWRTAPFDLGLIGFETSGEFHAADFRELGAESTRHVGIMLSRGATLQYYPRTLGAP